MKLKGQYLALEGMFTFAMGLMVALGAITIFNDYKKDVFDTATEREIETSTSQVQQGINRLKTLDNNDRGSTTVDLPKKMGGKDYKLALNGSVIVFIGEQQYSEKIPGTGNYNYQGSVDGGSIKIHRESNTFTVRAD